MAHCPIDQLQDLTSELDQMRSWPAMRERSPGVFYLKSTPFLHFHLKDGQRWADLRQGKDWERLDLPVGAKAPARRTFLAAVAARYAALTPPPTRPARKAAGA
jgi:hypothetical protein